MKKRLLKEKMEIYFPIISDCEHGFSIEMANAVERFFGPVCGRFSIMRVRNGRWRLTNEAMEHIKRCAPQPKKRRGRPRKLNLNRTCPSIVYFK